MFLNKRFTFWYRISLALSPSSSTSDMSLMIGPFAIDDFILFIIFLFSLMLYLSLLFALWRYRNDDLLSGTFFKFAFHLGVIDIIAMINVWILIKFREMGFFFDFFAMFDPFLAKFGSYMTWLVLYMQIAGITIITLNRFTNIVFPLRSIKVSVRGQIS